MKITSSLKIDLSERVVLAPIHAVQCDANTRAVAVTLTAGGVAWEPPAGVKVSVAFKKPDGKKGWYDKLPDGSSACSVSGNAVTAILAPEVLTVAGKVDAAIVFQDKNLNQLATFGFAILVEPNPAAGREISNDYYKYSTMEDISEAVDAMLDSLEDTKAEIGQLITQSSEAVSRAEQAAGPAIVCEASGAMIAVADSSDRLMQGLTLYGKTTQDGTPTPDAPVALESVGASGAINTTVAGKNRLPPSSASNGNFKADGKGGYTATDASGTIKIGEVTLEAGKTYTLSASAKSGVKKPCVMIRKPDGLTNIKTNYSNASLPVTYTSPETQTVAIVLQTMDVNGKCTSGETFYIQLEIGPTATAFEMYKEPQILTANTPNGLPGIPVTNGGNYTDENGKRWVCDEIDFVRGVYVQRCAKYVLDGALAPISVTVNDHGIANINFRHPFGVNMNYNTKSMCNRLSLQNSLISTTSTEGYIISASNSVYIRLDSARCSTVEEANAYLANNPIEFLYVLETPNETPLSAEELSQFAALHTNKPNTTVLNDSGAGMKLSYVADTKTYIDQKLAAISAAVLNK